MTVIEQLQKGKTFSLEVFPPKGSLTQVDVNRVLCDLSGARPDWISATCSAGGSGSRDNLATAKFIHDAGYTAVPHVTCINQMASDVDFLMESFGAEGIRDVMVLRGDLPSGYQKSQQTFKHAVDLVKRIRGKSDFCIGVAAYPEIHPESRCYADDIDILKMKQDAGADYAITQLFYYNDTYYRLRDIAVRSGITIPIIPGVMPVISSKMIRKICQVSNITVDSSLFSVLTMFDGNDEAIKCAGLAYTTKQIVDLLSNGVEHIHFYTMNKPELANKVYQNIKPLIGR